MSQLNNKLKLKEIIQNYGGAITLS